MVFRSRKEASCHDLEKKKWFLGQGRKRVVMTWRRKMVSGSRKQASQHDPEGGMISRSRKQAGQHDLEKKK